MKFHLLLSILIASLFFNLSCKAQESDSTVKLVGEMKNLMWKGQLEGNIDLDTISPKTNLYGFGPVEYLKGEILIWEGKSFQSSVISESEMKVEETFQIKAPFFAYAHISNWKEFPIPDSIRNLQDLEIYLEELTQDFPRPFFFKLEGSLEQAKIHVVNLPLGSKISSPADAHQGQVNYSLSHEEVKILGFFSTQHKTIFTHHDTFMHLHLITLDLQKMGHLDELSFQPEKMKLYLPFE